MSTDTSLKWGIPLALGIPVRKGTGLMRKDLGKNKKRRIREKLNTKEAYGVGRMLSKDSKLKLVILTVA